MSENSKDLNDSNEAKGGQGRANNTHEKRVRKYVTYGKAVLPFRPVRKEISLFDGYDPQQLAADLWGRLAQMNDDHLFLTSAGEPIRLEIVEETPRLVSLTNARLAYEIHRVATFVKPSGRSKVQCPAPASVISEMLGAPVSDIPLPKLRQVATAPLVAIGGEKIVTESGYHPALETFLWWTGKIDRLPTRPSRHEVKKALEIIAEPLQDFPFVDDASRATGLSVMLLPFVRRFIVGPTPLHLIEKATPGTGASLLTDVLLSPALGSNIARLSAPTHDAEWNYSLAAVLRDLPAAVVIDNARELSARDLAKVLTDDAMLTRIVGSTKTATIPIQCTWVATANNPILHQEIARRVIKCRLDAGVEQPWLGRTFKIGNLKRWLQEHRDQMVWACLLLVKAWLAAGQPKGTEMLGMFEDYSSVMGGLLENAGVKDFLLIRKEPEFIDLQTESEQWMVRMWHKHHTTETVGLTDVRNWALEDGSPLLELWGSSVRQENHLQHLGIFLRSIQNKTFTVDSQRVQLERRPDHPQTRRAQYGLTLMQTRTTKVA